MLTHAENELLCRIGPDAPMGRMMRRYWIPAAMSEELKPGGAIKRVRLLGEDLVAFRDTTGQVGLLGANCPHRGASLFFGRNEEKGLRCVYHGWKFDVTGACIDMPNEPPESNFKHKVKAVAYPCREWGGLIWTYMGPAGGTPALPALPEMEWALLPPENRFTSKFLVNANWLQQLEGGIDASHGSFLHKWFKFEDLPNKRSFLSRAVFDDPSPEMHIRPTEYGFAYGARRNAGEGQYHWRLYQWLLPAYRVLASQGGLCFSPGPIPIDDEHCWVYWNAYHPDRALTDEERSYYSSGATGNARVIPGTFKPLANKSNDYLIDREMQRSKNFTGMWSSADQDLMAVESAGALWDRTREHLGTSDSAVIAARRTLIRLARDLQKGIEPYAPNHGDIYRVRSLDMVVDEPEFGRFLEGHEAEAVVPR